MNKFNMKKILITIFIVISFLITPFLVLAQESNNFGLDDTASKVEAYKSQTGNSYDSMFVASTVGDIIGMVLSFVGVIFLILIIYGGISWMFSTGNEQKVDKAKKIIINAVIGLVIVFAAYFITDFIGSQFVK